jgi:hypothetical protein
LALDLLDWEFQETGSPILFPPLFFPFVN